MDDDVPHWQSRIERALALLAARLDDPPSLDELAAAAAVSPFHFHRIWRIWCGEPVGRTVARLRIAAAQDRLARPDASVTAVAMDGEFATPQSFARAFRRVNGTSPSEFLAGRDEAAATAPPPLPPSPRPPTPPSASNGAPPLPSSRCARTAAPIAISTRSTGSCGPGPKARTNWPG